MISVWRAPHRPLFLLAGTWAAVVPAVWLLPQEIAPDRIASHRDELLFGMAGAAAGGYLLTAVAAWSGRGPLPPTATLIVTLLWCASRLSAAFSRHLPPIAGAVGVSAYFFALAAILAHGIVAGRAWHRIWAPSAMVALGSAAILSRADTGGSAGVIAPGMMPLVFIMLILLIGGRATPAFTYAWLHRVGAEARFRDQLLLSHLTIAAIPVAAYLSATRHPTAAGLLFLLAAMMLLWRMKGWQTSRTRHYPALFILHLAFAWTPISLFLIGFANICPDTLPPAAALHAVTMGAMGSMICAFMMRAAMPRKRDILVLNRRMAWAFSLVWLSALLRILAGTIETGLDLLAVAAACWITGWACFLWTYMPALFGPVPRPVFSAVLGLEKRWSKPVSEPSAGENKCKSNVVRMETSYWIPVKLPAGSDCQAKTSASEYVRAWWSAGWNEATAKMRGPAV